MCIRPVGPFHHGWTPPVSCGHASRCTVLYTAPPHAHISYCTLEGAGVQSSQRINLTTLSMSASQTTHASHMSPPSLLLPWCWRLRLLRLPFPAAFSKALTLSMADIVSHEGNFEPLHANPPHGALSRQYQLKALSASFPPLANWPAWGWISHRDLRIGSALPMGMSIQSSLNDAPMAGLSGNKVQCT